MKLIGKKYIPNENTFCCNKRTGKPAYIAANYNEGEENANFEIISEVYKEPIDFFSSKIYTFIDVKSDKTGNVYRVLYRKENIIK